MTEYELTSPVNPARYIVQAPTLQAAYHSAEAALLMGDGPVFNEVAAAPLLPFYPARPVNGGPLEKALAKDGLWVMEPKLNGWRLVIHAPSGVCYNRHGKRLSIESEFRTALETIRSACRILWDTDRTEWVDAEGLCRRHGHGRGSLVLLDLPVHGGSFAKRRARLEASALPVHEVGQPIGENQVVLGECWTWDPEAAALEWRRMQEVNRTLFGGADFYEGLVCKRVDTGYPLQKLSPERTFPFWVKHRWAY